MERIVKHGASGALQESMLGPAMTNGQAASSDPVQTEREAVRGECVPGLRQANIDQAPGPACPWPDGAELERQLAPVVALAQQLAQPQMP